MKNCVSNSAALRDTILKKFSSVMNRRKKEEAVVDERTNGKRYRGRKRRIVMIDEIVEDTFSKNGLKTISWLNI